MIPILTPEEMAAVDRSSGTPLDELVGRAGAAVARTAMRMLSDATGGVYGRRAVVVAGRGNNGADGRATADRLRARGVAVTILDASSLPPGARLPAADLVIDAAYGTGLSRPYGRPDPGGAPVLAVDIPSGLSGLTGSPVGMGSGSPVRADATVTFAALKPGLMLGDGPFHAGTVELAAIGLGAPAAERARTWLVTDDDVADGLPRRPRDAHKWQSAVQVVAGSPGMSGAPWMVSRAAMRAGAGYVRLGMPGIGPVDAGLPPGELVSRALPAVDWAESALEGIDRCSALVVGPGLGAGVPASTDPAGTDPAGTDPAGTDSAGTDSAVGGPAVGATPVAALLRGAPGIPAVVDADGLNALGDWDAVAAVVAERTSPLVVTPHAGEYARLNGGDAGDDAVASVRAAARRSGAVVLLKGAVTIVASPDGEVLLSASGSARLATAGTGDVLSGVIGAFLARGVPAARAAAFGAHVHGRAADLGYSEGLVATDLPELIARWLSSTVG